MQRLLQRDKVPPENSRGETFRYTHAETGHRTVARDWYNWIDKAKLHLKGNGFPIPADLIAKMEDQLCGQLPPGWCDRENNAPWISTNFGWSDFVNGMKAFGALFAGGFGFVEQVEAERRAWICASCPYNVPVAGCGSCRKLATLITGDVARRRTEHDADLKACGVCHCAVRSMVHFPLEALETTDSPEKQALFPDFCWRQRTSANYAPSQPSEALA